MKKVLAILVCIGIVAAPGCASLGGPDGSGFAVWSAAMQAIIPVISSFIGELPQLAATIAEVREVLNPRLSPAERAARFAEEAGRFRDILALFEEARDRLLGTTRVAGARKSAFGSRPAAIRVLRTGLARLNAPAHD